MRAIHRASFDSGPMAHSISRMAWVSRAGIPLISGASSSRLSLMGGGRGSGTMEGRSMFLICSHEDWRVKPGLRVCFWREPDVRDFGDVLRQPL